jgi:post-segregation antitoxin (ccd killing protein)
MINISVSSRSLAAARRVDPDVSPAAVRAAVEVAIAEHMREQRQRRAEQSDDLGPDT